jgi:hypothetical protein
VNSHKSESRFHWTSLKLLRYLQPEIAANGGREVVGNSFEFPDSKSEEIVTAEDCKEHARRAFRSATEATTPESRSEFLNLTAQWLRLAEDLAVIQGQRTFRSAMAQRH